MPPIEFSGVRLPDNARLKLYKLEDYRAQEMEEFALLMPHVEDWNARMTLVLAFGQGKAGAVVAAVESPVAATMPASILQHHPAATFFLDEAAAAQLERSDYYRWAYTNKPDWQKNSIVFAGHAQ